MLVLLRCNIKVSRRDNPASARKLCSATFKASYLILSVFA
jgi:hypothetical protein